MTTISIITPVFETSISKITLDSMRNLTDNNFEWIIVHDNKPDSSIYEDVRDDNSDRILNIKIIELGNNYGPSVARNVGFQVSDGDIIAYLDNGDEIYSSRVLNLTWVFDNYSSNTDVVLSPYYIMSLGMKYNPLSAVGDIKNLGNILQKQNICIPLGIAHTRKAFVEVGGFQRGIVCGEDGILLRRMYEKGFNFGFLNTLAGMYYINDLGQSRTQRRYDMGGFAFDASNPKGSHGQYLDENWFLNYNSKLLFDERK